MCVHEHFIAQRYSETMFDFLKAYAVSWFLGGGAVFALIVYMLFFR
jgi:hypothetical protein